MIFRDLLGEYDTDSIPFGFELPVCVNGRNNDLHFANGIILGLFNFANETPRIVQAKRRAEFAARLINGEIILENGEVYIKTDSQYQDNKIVVSYQRVRTGRLDPFIVATKQPIIESGVEKNGSSEPNKGIVAGIVEAVKRGRGRPRKTK